MAAQLLALIRDLAPSPPKGDSDVEQAQADDLLDSMLDDDGMDASWL
jgi:hypothetical protein